MYSVVMMMAMTGAPEMPAFGFRRNGCDGGCAGYNAGCVGGRGRGCRGYDDGCGCMGGRRARRGGCGGGWGGGCGGYVANCGCCGVQAGCGCVGQMTAYGGCGGTMAVPAQTPAPPAMPPKNGKTEATMAAPATIVVSLPADAILKIDGTATTQTNDVRHFTTPTLAADQTFVYTLTAEVVRGGETLTSVQKVTVRAGEQTNVSLPVEQFATTLAMR